MTPTADTIPPPRWLIVVLALIAIVAVAAPAWLVAHAPAITPVAKRVVKPRRVVPKAELPPVEPVALQDLAPTDAREYNATVPFSRAPNPAAAPFRIFGTPEDQARALDCLAAGVIYEAGDDPVGEKAVAQVILNRVRHPAFPHSICGVVFQGSERKTGCQFTFTCDGAMARPVRAAAWDRARAIALAALSGEVDGRVGHATHYHTDWVVPYWSASLDKITEVHTHLFFRWTGWWGTPPAFASRYLGAEPNIPQLARLSPAHRAADGALLPVPATGEPGALPGSVAIPKGLEQDENAFLVTLDAALPAEMYPALALKACGDRPYCKFMAWTSKAATPAALPITPVQQRAMSFSYLRDRAFGFEKALWNCVEFKRAEAGQCMKSQLSISMAPPPPASFTYDATPGSALRAIAGAAATPPPVVPTAQPPRPPLGPDPLTGLRRKTDARVPMDAADKPAAAPAAPVVKTKPDDAAPAPRD